MSKKLTGNGRWESSRFIMPEHRAAMLRYDLERQKIKRPELTDEEKEAVFGLLQSAKDNTLPVTIKVFTLYEIAHTTGTVDKFDQQLRFVKLEIGNGDFRQIPYEDILGAEF